jgi:type IV pilus assembly protein PilM
VFRRTRSVVGLDIGSSAVKAVELKPSGKGHRVVAFGAEALPTDSIVDGALVDGAAVADAIRRLFAARGIKTREVAASLSGSAVIVKKISLPPMSESELADAIFWEAEQYIPFDVQDVNLDYQIISGASNGGAAGVAATTSGMEVLLVAAKKEKIADYTGVIVQAGLVPIVVDVDAFAVQNAYEANHGAAPGRVVVLLNVGASAVNVNVLSGEHSLFTRDISIGGHAYNDALEKEFRLSPEDAEQLKRGRTLDNGFDLEHARPVLRAVTESVLLEVQKTFDFFRGTTGTEHIDRIVLSGGTSRIDGFAEMIGERFDTPVEDLDPFRTIGFDAARFGVEAAEVAPMSAVAVGLALRKVGDR